MDEKDTNGQNGHPAKASLAKTGEVPGSAWGDRISALKNVPPVLEILWESGPAVVAWGVILRLVVAGLPALLGYISSWILGHVKLAIDHQPLPPRTFRVQGGMINSQQSS